MLRSCFGRYKAFDEQGIGYAKTAVGDKYVYENMVQNGHRIGGEQSGHIIFSKYATTGDGILTSLKIMEVMLEKKETLSRLASEVTILPQVLKNVRVADKAAALARFTAMSDKVYPAFAGVLGGQKPTIKVRDMTSRWGVCYMKRRQITFALESPIFAIPRL